MEFYTNPDKRITVAVMTHVQRDIANYLYALLRNKNRDCFEDLYGVDILRNIINKTVPNVLRAKAKCAPNDIFSEDWGKKLAGARLLSRYYNHCFNVFMEYDSYINEHINMKMIDAMDRISDKANYYDDIQYDLLVEAEAP